MVLRDTNDLSRRPPKGTPVQRRITQSVATKAETPPDIAARHAESSPENPQGGQWVKFRIDAGGAPLGYEQMMSVLEKQGYRRADGT